MAAETKIIVKNIKPYDGEYELDLAQAFSAREWRWVKQISEGDVTPLTVNLADPDFIVAIIVIAMVRAGKITRKQVMQVADVLADAPMDEAHITLVLGEEAEEEVPPALTVEPERSSSSGSTENGKPESTPQPNGGSSSSSASAPWGANLDPTGATK